uniref:Uncharacterized protein n=1 Tax=viral metagenome TaxID=1070528 RepID=A0A6C0KUS4_9ZZZZ
MSQEQFNDLVKRMLDFGHETQSPPISTEQEKKDTISIQQGKVNDIPLPPLEQPKQQQMSRKERRNQERVTKRLQKVKKMNLKKEENSSDTKARLEKAKEERRKSGFTDDDRTRIERILFNKTK